jgi:hypothetical protein
MDRAGPHGGDVERPVRVARVPPERVAFDSAALPAFGDAPKFSSESTTLAQQDGHREEVPRHPRPRPRRAARAASTVEARRDSVCSRIGRFGCRPGGAGRAAGDNIYCERACDGSCEACGKAGSPTRRPPCAEAPRGVGGDPRQGKADHLVGRPPWSHRQVASRGGRAGICCESSRGRLGGSRKSCGRP